MYIIKRNKQNKLSTSSKLGKNILIKLSYLTIVIKGTYKSKNINIFYSIFKYLR